MTLNRNVIDLPSPGGPPPFPLSTRYVLATLLHPPDRTEWQKLASRGLQVLERVGPLTFVFRVTGEFPPSVTRHLAWYGPYPTAAKLDRELFARCPARPTSFANWLSAPPAGHLSGTCAVVVVFHRGADVAAAAREVARLTGLGGTASPQGGRMRVDLGLAQLGALVSIDDVRRVERVRGFEPHANVARGLLALDHPSGQSVPYRGAGEIVAVSDSGFDLGSTTDVHPAFVGRVAHCTAFWKPDATDWNGHGTHLAGLALGDGHPGFPLRGSAPSASLVAQSIIDEDGTWRPPAPFAHLLEPPYLLGSRLHNLSWGDEVGDGRYDVWAEELDEYLRQHDDLVVCVSAGNRGRDKNGDGMLDAGTVTAPGTAKNAVTVGASESFRPKFHQMTYGSAYHFGAPFEHNLLADAPDGLVPFAGRGPVDGGRIKPDVVAPGTWLLSTRSRETDSQGWQLYEEDTGYMFNGGTSASSALVVGCCAVVREYLRTARELSPSAALVKAVLINAATDVAGQYDPSEAPPVPNPAEGFGLVQMDAAVGARAGEMLLIDDGSIELDTGGSRHFTLTVPPGQTSVKVTLVWTDPPGPLLQNDLDLLVRVGSEERHGNQAPGSAAFDRHNNVEQVTWDNLAPGTEVKVEVHARVVTFFPQRFALVGRVR